MLNNNLGIISMKQLNSNLIIRDSSAYIVIL